MIKDTTDYSKPTVAELHALFYIKETPTARTIHNRIDRSRNSPKHRQAGTRPKPTSYSRIEVRGRHYQAHRVMWAMQYGKWPAKDLDHINGDITDNRSCNLREASRAENSRNRKKQKNNLSGVTGVTWAKPNNKWKTQIRVEDKLIHLGYYEDLELATLVYSVAADKYHGAFQRRVA